MEFKNLGCQDITGGLGVQREYAFLILLSLKKLKISITSVTRKRNNLY